MPTTAEQTSYDVVADRHRTKLWPLLHWGGGTSRSIPRLYLAGPRQFFPNNSSPSYLGMCPLHLHHMAK